MPAGLRSDGRQHDTGLILPYRNPSPDFEEVYLLLGQGKEIEEHYQTNWRCVRCWSEECGGDDLRTRRHARSGGFARPSKRGMLVAA